MKKADAIQYFGSQAALGKAVGVSQAAISKWPDDVPKLRAYQIESLTNGELKAEEVVKPASAA